MDATECNSVQTLRDRDYWNEYYSKHICPTEPSDFAKYVSAIVKPNRTLIDLGCGNGRDALFFAQNSLNVIAVDLSDEAISTLRAQNQGAINFLLDDFVHCPVHRPDSYDYAYSRFTLHAVDKNQGTALIQNVYRGLRPDGKFFIEVRGTKDPLFGLGEQIAENTFVYDGHSRRFLVLDELINDLTDAGFAIEYAVEQTGFAVYQGNDPPVIRVVAVKPRHEKHEKNNMREHLDEE